MALDAFAKLPNGSVFTPILTFPHQGGRDFRRLREGYAKVSGACGRSSIRVKMVYNSLNRHGEDDHAKP